MRFLVGISGHLARGQSVSGDAVRVVRSSEDDVLIAVADGLGHGGPAAEASAMLCAYVEGHSTAPLEAILRGCGDALAKSRGAVAALLRLRPRGALEFCGVGNVAFHARSARPISALSLPGILGRKVRALRTFSADVCAGDLLVLHTDGVSSRLELERVCETDPQHIADEIVATMGREYDDAACAVVRCVEPEGVRGLRPLGSPW